MVFTRREFVRAYGLIFPQQIRQDSQAVPVVPADRVFATVGS